MFLSPPEIELLTDRKQPAAQIRWLEAHGWRFEVGASGRPKVLRAEAERHMLSGQPGARRRKELNMKALAA